MKQGKTRGRFDSAHVIAILSLFVALSGIAYASVGKNDVRSKHIKNRQVRTPDLANNAVKSVKVQNENLKGRDIKDETLSGADVENDSLTGLDVQESSLGTVPNAQQANNSDTVDGLHARAFRFAAASGTGFTQVVSIGHLKIEAACDGVGDIETRFTTSRDNSSIHVAGVDTVSANVTNGAENDDFDITEPLFGGAATDDSDQGTFTFYSPATSILNPGHTISGTYLSEEGAGALFGTDCLFAGTLQAATPSGIFIVRKQQKGAENVEEVTDTSGSGSED